MGIHALDYDQDAGIGFASSVSLSSVPFHWRAQPHILRAYVKSRLLIVLQNFCNIFAMAVGGLWWLMSATKTGLVPHDGSESLSRFNLFPTISVFGEQGEGV